MFDFSSNGLSPALLGLRLISDAYNPNQNGNQSNIGSMLMQLAMSRAANNQNNGINMNTPGYQSFPIPAQPSQQNINTNPTLPTIPNFTNDPAQTLKNLGYNDQNVLNNIPGIAQKIGTYESGNRYNTMGPQTSSGDRAYGRYQIMGNNIPSWTKEVLGRQMTPQEFLNDPSAQDAVALAKMAQSYSKYGNPQDVASIWFSGRPYGNNNSRDILGTSVPKYISNTVGFV